jgi:hypothetical protein
MNEAIKLKNRMFYFPIFDDIKCAHLGMLWGEFLILGCLHSQTI